MHISLFLDGAKQAEGNITHAVNKNGQRHLLQISIYGSTSNTEWLIATSMHCVQRSSSVCSASYVSYQKECGGHHFYFAVKNCDWSEFLPNHYHLFPST